MKMELKKLDVLQTGRVIGMLYTFVMVIMLPIMLIGMAANPKGSEKQAVTLILVVLYPLLGFIGGVLVAALYNLATKWVGGIKMTLEETE